MPSSTAGGGAARTAAQALHPTAGAATNPAVNPDHGNSLASPEALEDILRSGRLSAVGLALVAQPRFQHPGQCHINALQNVYAHASGDVASPALDWISHLDHQSHLNLGPQSAVLGAMAAVGQGLMHVKVSATGRPPQGFENAESRGRIDTPQALAAWVRERGAVVVQGTGRAMTAPDSDLRQPLPSQFAVEIGQPVVSEPDGTVNSNHSVVVLAVSTPQTPVPGLAYGQCLVFDQDPDRRCIRQALDKAGLSQIPSHHLTPQQIKSAGVDHLMTRVVSFDDLSKTQGTANAGVLPIGGLFGGRFFVLKGADR